MAAVEEGSIVAGGGVALTRPVRACSKAWAWTGDETSGANNVEIALEARSSRSQ
jgi:hypothetical protein